MLKKLKFLTFLLLCCSQVFYSSSGWKLDSKKEMAGCTYPTILFPLGESYMDKVFGPASKNPNEVICYHVYAPKIITFPSLELQKEYLPKKKRVRFSEEQAPNVLSQKRLHERVSLSVELHSLQLQYNGIINIPNEKRLRIVQKALQSDSLDLLMSITKKTAIDFALDSQDNNQDCLIPASRLIVLLTRKRPQEKPTELEQLSEINKQLSDPDFSSFLERKNLLPK